MMDEHKLASGEPAPSEEPVIEPATGAPLAPARAVRPMRCT